ncbi:MAG: DUF951 domain-containing protein [Eubacteriaceae bacterium]|nr:DUF951 domain-containing protein [Eubacteriaceae bacterium]
MDFDYSLGSIVQMRKKHPCGSFEWEVLRMGADIKIRCLGCDRQVMLARSKFDKGIKKVVSNKKDGMG